MFRSKNTRNNQKETKRSNQQEQELANCTLKHTAYSYQLHLNKAFKKGWEGEKAQACGNRHSSSEDRNVKGQGETAFCLEKDRDVKFFKVGGTIACLFADGNNPVRRKTGNTVEGTIAEAISFKGQEKMGSAHVGVCTKGRMDTGAGGGFKESFWLLCKERAETVRVWGRFLFFQFLRKIKRSWAKSGEGKGYWRFRMRRKCLKYLSGV